MLTPNQVEAYHREGFLIVPSVFTREEIETFQRAGTEHARSGAAGWFLHKIQGLQDLWLDARLISIARALLDGPITYFLEATFLRKSFAENPYPGGRRNLHHDAKGTPGHLYNRMHEPMDFAYPVLRMGIYMQNYSEWSGALKVSPGSHKIDTSKFDQAALPFVNVIARPGDVVCFNTRTLHTTNALRARSEPDLVLSPDEEALAIAEVPEAFLPHPPLREAMFIDYSESNWMADLFIKNRACQAWDSHDGLVAAFHDRDMAKNADRAGIQLRMDSAVIEAVRMINSNAVNGVLQADGAAILLKLPKLCQYAKECSPHFPLIPELAESYTSESLVVLANEIAHRLKAYIKTSPTRSRDIHMEGGDP
jgi:hypothetical protein